MIELHLKPEWKKEIETAENIMLIPPASFLEMIMLEKNAAIILTDSGGVQKEAFFFEKPCVILRPETEWVELVELGAAIIADTHPEKIIDAFRLLMHKKDIKYEKVYGDGIAADHKLNTMLIHKCK
jgi:UDP-GlcNAc3NAcA epimerase